MPEVWIKLALVRELTGWSWQHIMRLAAQGKLKWRLSESRGKNGKHEREYLLASLPADAQARHAQKQSVAIVERTAETMPLFANLPEPLPEPQRAAVPKEYADQVDGRYKAIEPLLDFRRRTNGHRPNFRLGDGRVVSNLGDLAEYIASQQQPPVSSRTVFRWLDRFETSGYASLADSPRKDKGQSHFFEEHPAAAAFLQNKFLTEVLSARLSWEAMVREWAKLEKRGEAPSYATARRYLRALPIPLATLARQGDEAFHNQCSPFILRKAPPAMDWWIADHRWHDVIVRNTAFDTKRPQEAFRLWLTAIYDWGSRKIVGYVWAPTPSSRTISSALRMAVLSYGFPRQRFLWDNGKDFKKVKADLEAFQLSDEVRGLLQNQKVEISAALPKHPRSKPIESYFARISKRFDVLWKPAYCGNRPDHCAPDCREAKKQHGQFLAGKRDTSPLPEDHEFILGAMQHLEEYNDTPLESLNGKSPNEVFDEQYPERARPQIDPRLLTPLFWERDTRKVLAGGCVELDRMRYEPEGASLGPLHLRCGRTVLIARDPYNLGQAIALDPETSQFVGELRVQPRLAQDPADPATRDQVKARLRLERSVKRAYSDWLSSIASTGRASGWKTEREALMGRAGVRTGTDNLPALPAAAVPGARQITERVVMQKPTSPFVDDAVREFLAEEVEL